MITGGPRVVVIGLGNPYRRDDGAGTEVIRRLRASAPDGVELFEHDGEPVGLLGLWEGADVVFVVDAVRASTMQPAGTCTRIDAGAISRAGHDHHSSHGLSLPEAVGLARALDRLPAHLVVIGIAVADVGDGTGLSAPVAAACAALAADLAVEVAAARAATPLDARSGSGPAAPP